MKEIEVRCVPSGEGPHMYSNLSTKTISISGRVETYYENFKEIYILIL
ncbi:MAG: hypothetical protein ACJAWV_001488 [Flammeovirgaceae bacterium]|jgi:hypothetical protein